MRKRGMLLKNSPGLRVRLRRANFRVARDIPGFRQSMPPQEPPLTSMHCSGRRCLMKRVKAKLSDHNLHSFEVKIHHVSVKHHIESQTPIVVIAVLIGVIKKSVDMMQIICCAADFDWKFR